MVCRFLSFAENMACIDRQDIAQQCPRGSCANFYKWRAKVGGMDASMISEMKALAEENRRLKRVYAEMSMQNDLLKEVLGKKHRPSLRKEMAVKAVADRGISIALACRAFSISESCCRYERKLSGENVEIADWLEKLTSNRRTWGYRCI